MIKLIVCDLDGTALNDQKVLDSNLKKVAVQLRKQGVELTFASGRNYYLVQEYLKELDVRLPYICDNGANTYLKEERVHNYTVKEEIVERISDNLKAKQVPFLIYTDTTVFNYSSTKNLERFTSRLIGKMEMVDLLGGRKDYHDIFKVTVDSLNNEEYVSELAMSLMKEEPSICFKRSENTLFTITSSEATKGKALKQLLSDLKLTKDEVMVFGDNYNDLSLFAEAGISVTMKDATDDIKVNVDYVTCSNNNNGVSSFLISYFKLGEIK